MVTQAKTESTEVLSGKTFTSHLGWSKSDVEMISAQTDALKIMPQCSLQCSCACKSAQTCQTHRHDKSRQFLCVLLDEFDSHWKAINDIYFNKTGEKNIVIKYNHVTIHFWKKKKLEVKIRLIVSVQNEGFNINPDLMWKSFANVLKCLI